MAAVDSVKNGDFEESKKLIKDAEDALQKAHVEHTNLLSEDAKGEKIEVTLLLVHASNHLSVAEVTLDFAKEIIELYERNK